MTFERSPEPEPNGNNIEYTDEYHSQLKRDVQTYSESLQDLEKRLQEDYGRIPYTQYLRMINARGSAQERLRNAVIKLHLIDYPDLRD